MKQSKSRSENPASKYLLSNAVVNFFLLAMFAVFPLFVSITFDGNFPFMHFDNGFFGIRHQKFYFFVTMSAIALIVEVMLIITNISSDKKDNTLRKSFFDTLSFTDWAAAALLVSCTLSTIFSPHPDLAFWGEISYGSSSIGRNNGLFLIIIYILLYFMISRLYRFREYVFVGLAISCGIVYLLTVLNGYYIDPLNMLEQFKTSQPKVYMEFFSTIGNKNMLASFICVTLPVLFVMSVITQTLWKRILYLVSTGLGAMAMLIGDSDSALLGMGVFLMVFLVVFARDITRLKRYFLALTVMLASFKLARLFSLMMNDNYKELGDLVKGILFSPMVYVLLVVTAIITAALYLLDSKKPDLTVPKAVPVAIGACFGFIVAALLGVFIYFSVIDRNTDLGSMEKLLRMSDAWGTHRGIMWLRSFNIFHDANLWQKLFGTGPDTFYFAFQPYFTQLQEYGDSSTDAAHNEYINYLITIGIAGTLSYLAFTGSALVRGFKASKKAPVALACAAAVVCYLAQAVVNIALPIATPLFFIFVAMCEGCARMPEDAA